jgi:RNA polymerase sigma-70 factor, ECF subfamily
METDERIVELMNHYGSSVLHLAYSYVRNRQTAEDLTQEIFIKCYEKLNTFNENSSLQTWLYKISVNHCKDYLKSWHYRKIYVSNLFVPLLRSQDDSPEVHFMKKTENEELINNVLKLPVKYREVIFLHYFQDLSQKEISLICDINLNTVKSRLSRAKELLKNSIEERSTDDGRAVKKNKAAPKNGGIH